MPPEEERIVNIHRRMDSFAEELANLRVEVREHATRCSSCHPIVMGNGHEPMDTRLTKLEEARRNEEKNLLAEDKRANRRLAMLVGMASGIGALISLIAQVAIKLMGSN